MFEDRRAAGLALADRLSPLKETRPVICALLRGGAPVASEIAHKLNAPLRSILVKKIGAPGHPEYAIGAVADASPPAFILHRGIIEDLGVADTYVDQAKAAAMNEIDRRRRVFLDGAEPQSVAGRNVVIVDDGLATGATMEAAIAAMRQEGATQIISAVPVASPEAAARIRRIADELIAIEKPQGFVAVSAHYRRFPQLSDAEVKNILAEFAAPAER